MYEFNRLVQISVVKFNKGFSNCTVNVHIHPNLLLDNKRAITGLRGCVYSKPLCHHYIIVCKTVHIIFKEQLFLKIVELYLRLGRFCCC